MVGAGEEGGQSTQVGVVDGEEGLALLPRRQQAGLRGETGQSVGAQQGRRRPVGMFRGVLHADGAPPRPAALAEEEEEGGVTIFNQQLT